MADSQGAECPRAHAVVTLSVVLRIGASQKKETEELIEKVLKFEMELIDKSDVGGKRRGRDARITGPV